MCATFPTVLPFLPDDRTELNIHNNCFLPPWFHGNLLVLLLMTFINSLSSTVMTFGLTPRLLPNIWTIDNIQTLFDESWEMNENSTSLFETFIANLHSKLKWWSFSVNKNLVPLRQMNDVELVKTPSFQSTASWLSGKFLNWQSASVGSNHRGDKNKWYRSRGTVIWVELVIVA